MSLSFPVLHILQVEFKTKNSTQNATILKLNHKFVLTSFVDKEICYAVKQKGGIFALRRLHLLFIQGRIFVDEMQICFIYFQPIQNHYWFCVRLLKPYNFPSISLNCQMHHFPFKHFSCVRLFFFPPLEIMDV